MDGWMDGWMDAWMDGWMGWFKTMSNEDQSKYYNSLFSFSFSLYGIMKDYYYSGQQF